jgi:hypothetical protein
MKSGTSRGLKLRGRPLRHLSEIELKCRWTYGGDTVGHEQGQQEKAGYQTHEGSIPSPRKLGS